MERLPDIAREVAAPLAQTEKVLSSHIDSHLFDIIASTLSLYTTPSEAILEILMLEMVPLYDLLWIREKAFALRGILRRERVPAGVRRTAILLEIKKMAQ